MLLVFFLLSGTETISAEQGKIYKYPKECVKGNIVNVTECSGYGQFGFQSNYDYDIRAYGDANKKLCKAYQKADFSKSFMSDIKTPNELPKAFLLNSNDGHNCDFNSPDISWAQ